MPSVKRPRKLLKVPLLLKDLFITERSFQENKEKKTGLWALSALLSIIFKIYSDVPKGHISQSEYEYNSRLSL